MTVRCSNFSLHSSLIGLNQKIYMFNCIPCMVHFILSYLKKIVITTHTSFFLSANNLLICFLVMYKVLNVIITIYMAHAVSLKSWAGWPFFKMSSSQVWKNWNLKNTELINVTSCNSYMNIHVHAYIIH